MKKFLPILSLAFLITACSSGPQETETRTIQSAQQTLPVDTAGLAAFQQWKTQNELNAVEQPVQQAEQPLAAAPVRTVTIVREVRVQEPAKRTVRKQQPAPVQERPTPVETPQQSPDPAAGNGNSDVASNTGSGTADAPTTGQEKVKEGGWSNAKKGAVVDGAGGAVIGAVIGKKNRAAGAIIGGVLGGAVGYGLGKKKDNKEAQQ